MAAIYVGDLQSGVTEGLLVDRFCPAGHIKSVHICRDRKSGSSLGYAYINFQHRADAERALDMFNFELLLGKPMRVMWSRYEARAKISNLGNIFLKNLEPSIDNMALFDTFAVFGRIVSCKVVSNGTGSTNHGYIQFESAESADLAIKQLNGKLLNDHQVTIELFKSYKQREAEARKTWDPEPEQGHAETQGPYLYIKNLEESIDDTCLHTVFSTFGTIKKAKVMMENGQSRGFGFVCFSCPQEAMMARRKINGWMWGKKAVYVGVAIRRGERQAQLDHQPVQRPCPSDNTVHEDNTCLDSVPAVEPVVPDMKTLLLDDTVTDTETSLSKDTAPDNRTALSKNTVPVTETDQSKDIVPVTNTAPSNDTFPGTKTALTKDTVRVTETALSKNTVPVRNTGPSKNTVPVTKTAPSKDTVPVTKTAPSKDTVPVTKTAPSKETVPVTKTAPSKNTVLVTKTAPSKDTVPVTKTAPSKDTVPFTKTAPSKDTVPVTNTAPSNDTFPATKTAPSKDTVPFTKTALTKDTVRVTKTAPSKNTVPVRKTDPSKNTVPVTKTAPSKDTVPVPNTAPSNDTFPGTKTALTKDTVRATKTGPSKDTVPVTKTAPSKNTVLVTKTAPSKDILPDTKTALTKDTVRVTNTAPSKDNLPDTKTALTKDTVPGTKTALTKDTVPVTKIMNMIGDSELHINLDEKVREDDLKPETRKKTFYPCRTKKRRKKGKNKRQIY